MKNEIKTYVELSDATDKAMAIYEENPTSKALTLLNPSTLTGVPFGITYEVYNLADDIRLMEGK